jgi:hypothetical protein
MPIAEKIATDSGCAVNLKESVCKKMTAAIILDHRESTFISMVY